MRLLGLLVCIVYLVGFNGNCLGRLVNFPQPEQVYKKAQVVCVGVATSITPTGERGLREQMPVKRMKARVRVAASLKGRTEKEIDFLYWSRDHDRMRPVVHIGGPLTIALKKGQRARFYLKKVGTHYVNAYEGQYDDGFTVDILAPGEPDRSLPMKRDSAVKIARDFLSRKGVLKAYDVNRPAGSYMWGFGFPSSWRVIFFRARGVSGSMRAPGLAARPASIIITVDGTIDEARTDLGN
jgi:hypothetical protein